MTHQIFIFFQRTVVSMHLVVYTSITLIHIIQRRLLFLHVMISLYFNSNRNVYYLQSNITYVLFLTTSQQPKNVKGAFIVMVSGPNNIILNKVIKKHSNCVIGDSCDPYQKTIGLSINDILRNQIQRNISFEKQSSLIKIAVQNTNQYAKSYS